MSVGPRIGVVGDMSNFKVLYDSIQKRPRPEVERSALGPSYRWFEPSRYDKRSPRR